MRFGFCLIERSPFSALVLLAMGSAAWADGDCTALSEDTARLACYDAAHGVETTEDQGDAADTGAWIIEREKNALTDREDVFVGIRASETAQCGYQSIRPTLYLRCMDNTTAALLVTDFFMADIQGFGKVRYRVDGGSMKSWNFEERTDNMALGLWTFGRSTPFIRDLLGGETLIMEYTPFNDIPKQSTFDISGVDEAIAPMREACGW
ncbi:type VI secretion system-associated protein TagO [Roseovarius sp.]|uniref:type VI secretion system-associated protein TagO n=1 Tax=Roseovarius sp. TaxID=1486281 RepID=UPI0026108DD4|nr:type VI secretion system-associated protein TagO [Roseovarius sp.]MDW3118012.1 type VI secretion system-associated protein TagO [Roseovarius pacificus]